MKILNLLAAEQTGGIEVLCQNIVVKSKEDNRICCLFGEGEIFDNLKEKGITIFSTKSLNKNIDHNSLSPPFLPFSLLIYPFLFEY